LASVPKRVYDYLADHPGPICDDCLRRTVGLANRIQASQVTSALGVTPLFFRTNGVCSLCGRGKMVIRKS
jgi:hypothetical protein